MQARRVAAVVTGEMTVVAEDAGRCREEALRCPLTASVFGLPGASTRSVVDSIVSYLEPVVRDDMPRVHTVVGSCETTLSLYCNLMLLSISREHASSFVEARLLASKLSGVGRRSTGVRCQNL